MRYYLFILTALLTFTCACAEHEELPAPGSEERMRLTLLLRGEAPTRTGGDEALHDVNIYLFDRSGLCACHLYATSAAVGVELLKGRYTLYAVANAGRDMGDATLRQIEQMTCDPDPATLGDGPLPMSARQEIEVTGDGRIPVPLTRAVARVDFSFSVQGEFASRLTVRSVQLRSAARTMHLFRDSRAELAAHVADLPAVTDPGSEFSATYYLLENRQGTVPGITAQGQKDSAHAPAFATYFQIEASAAGVEIIYRIFLGENNTSDFNIIRNRVYRLDVRILGMNALDARVTTTSLDVDPFEQQYEQGMTARSELQLQCANSPAGGSYTLRYVREQGTGTLRVNGLLLAPGADFPLHPYKGEVTVPLEYTQPDVGEVRLNLALEGPDGVLIERQLFTSFIKPRPHVVCTIDKPRLYAMDRAIATITVSQTGYTGKYTVSCSGTASLFINLNADLNPATSLTFPGPGSYTLRVRPEAVGSNPFTLTVQDAEGQRATTTASVVGLKRTATYTLSFDSSVAGELSVMAQGDYPVPEDVNLIVRPTLQLYAGSSVTTKTYTMPISIQKGRDVAGYTLDLGLAAGQSYALSSYTAAFSRTVSKNGMVEYRVK